MGQAILDSLFSGENGLGNTLIKMFAGSDADRKAAIEYATGRTYNKATMIETGSDTTSYTCDMTPPAPFAKNEIDGTHVLADDMQTVIPAYQTPEEPPVKATLTYASKEYTIEKVWPIVSGNEVCNYRLLLRSV